jgi:cytochrome c556
MLVDAGRAAAQAADARDADRLMAASDRAYEACEQCHAKYFPGTTR